MRRTLTALALALVSAAPAYAIEPCTKILSDLSFCPSEAWSRVDVPLEEGMMVWQKGDITAKMMAQGLVAGSVEGPDQVLEAIKASVRGSLADPDAVTFAEFHVAPGSIVDRGIIAYDLHVNDKLLRIHHSFMLGEEVLIQFVSSTDADGDTDKLEAHREFITAFKMIEGQEEA